MARQGMALARWLVEYGERVTLSDSQSAERLSDALKSLDGLPIEYALGGHPLSLLDGCDLLCLSGGVPVDLPIVVEARRRGIPLTNDAQIFLERCAATVIGVTGSAGKTTTTTLVGEMARAADRTTWVGGNIGNPLISDMHKMQASDIVVMELSSFQLELMTCSPAIAAVLNVTPNHLDRHGTMKAYTEAKAHILDHQAASDTAILGYDDAVARSLAKRVRGNVMYFSRDLQDAPGAYVKDKHVVVMDETEQPVCALNEIRLRGAHNVLNVLAACALASAAGLPVDAMREAIRNFSGVTHRLQLVRDVNGVRYYDDSIATAPERMVAAIHSFDEPIVLLAGGRDKKLPWEEAATLIRKRVRRLVVFGEMAGLVATAVEEQRAMDDVLEQIHRVDSLADAVSTAAQVAHAGDVVLLSPGGTSFDAFKDFAERGDAFQEYVKAI
jgi:UDP-N-acetylmuramoylalanine--D-glutamate ligase